MVGASRSRPVRDEAGAVESVVGASRSRREINTICSMRNPRDFFKPLAIDAPEPAREIPFKPSRMIHFMDFSNPKMVEKTPDLAPKVDILLGNLEDASRSKRRRPREPA